MFWNRKHKHKWLIASANGIINEDGKTLGEIRTYHCYRCGSIRYDKIDSKGFVSSIVTDDTGKVISREGKF